MSTHARFRLCRTCSRAVPAESKERYCINDGSRLLESCLGCGAHITSPYARFCPACGQEYRSSMAEPNPADVKRAPKPKKSGS